MLPRSLSNSPVLLANPFLSLSNALSNLILSLSQVSEAAKGSEGLAGLQRLEAEDRRL